MNGRRRKANSLQFYLLLKRYRDMTEYMVLKERKEEVAYFNYGQQMIKINEK